MKAASTATSTSITRSPRIVAAAAAVAMAAVGGTHAVGGREERERRGREEATAADDDDGGPSATSARAPPPPLQSTLELVFLEIYDNQPKEGAEEEEAPEAGGTGECTAAGPGVGRRLRLGVDGSRCVDTTLAPEVGEGGGGAAGGSRRRRTNVMAAAAFVDGRCRLDVEAARKRRRCDDLSKNESVVEVVVCSM